MTAATRTRRNTLRTALTTSRARHTAKAYRAANGGDSVKVWTQHRTTGKWIHVFVYGPIDQALYAALTTYKGTRHLLASNFAEAA